tara:strand:+ start:3574 stop:4485 length:912 start_codon:yes stop_codon:yes gene_type:complete
MISYKNNYYKKYLKYKQKYLELKNGGSIITTVSPKFIKSTSPIYTDIDKSYIYPKKELPVKIECEYIGMSKLRSNIDTYIYRPVFLINVSYTSLNGNKQNKLPFFLSSNTSSPTKISNVIYPFNGVGFHNIMDPVPWLIKCSILYDLKLNIDNFNYNDYKDYNSFIESVHEEQDIINSKMNILKDRIKNLRTYFRYKSEKKYEMFSMYSKKICCIPFHNIRKSFNTDFDIGKYLDKENRFSFTYKTTTTTINFNNIIEDTTEFNKIIGTNNFFGLDLSNIKSQYMNTKGPTIDEILYTLLNNI